MKNEQKDIEMFKQFLLDNNCLKEFNEMIFSRTQYHNLDTMLCSVEVNEFIIDRVMRIDGGKQTEEWQKISQLWKSLFVGYTLISKAIENNENHFKNIREKVNKPKKQYEEFGYNSEADLKPLPQQLFEYTQKALKDQNYEAISELKDIFDNAIENFEI